MMGGMDANALRALQAPLKETYKQNPGAALVTLKARGEIDDAKVACKVETGRALVLAGLHPATGGSGAELCSGDMLLEALVACAGVTLKAVATALEIRFARPLCAPRAISISGEPWASIGGARWFPGHSPRHRRGHRRPAGQARRPPQVDRALLASCSSR